MSSIFDNDERKSVLRPRFDASSRVELTDEMIMEIAKLVEAGNYISVACAASGIHRATYQAWMHTGQRVSARLEATEQEIDPDEYPPDLIPADVEPYEWQCYKLFWVLETSEAKAEATAVILIRKQMPEQWTAAMTFLERRYPDRWRKRQTFEQVTIDGGSIDEQAVIEDPEAVSMVHDLLEKIQAGETIETTAEDVPKLDEGRLLDAGEKKESQSED